MWILTERGGTIVERVGRWLPRARFPAGFFTLLLNRILSISARVRMDDQDIVGIVKQVA